MIFYLKANRNNSYVLPNLKHWLDAVMLYEDSIAYILCDNLELKDRIVNKLNINYERVFFIESDRDSVKMNSVLQSFCRVNRWYKVGQAHLKTHWHSVEHGYPFFWNIDADDTFICLDPIRIVELLKKVEDYCKDNDIKMMSLDMWRTMSVNEYWPKGDNWSLGIVFVDNRVPWIDIFDAHKNDELLRKMITPLDGDMNLDWFFTYLRRIKAETIETFYVENMRFIHFYDYFINYPHLSNFCYWRNGELHYPIISECFGAHFRNNYKIAEDIIKIDIGIKDDESMLALIASSGEVSAFWNDVRDNRLEVGNVMKKRCELFLNKNNKTRLAFWGVGSAFFRNVDLIRKAYDVDIVCDSDPAKWDKNVYDGVRCISPEELSHIKDDIFVVITIDSPSANLKVVRALMDMGIYSFDHFDNWIEIVTGVSD